MNRLRRVVHGSMRQLNSGGKGGDKITSAKRIAKKLMTSYREACEEEWEKMPPETMDAVKVAAMFKASNVNPRQQIR